MSIASKMRLDRANSAIDDLTVGEFLELVHRRMAAIDCPAAICAMMRLGWAVVAIAERRAAELEARRERG